MAPSHEHGHHRQHDDGGHHHPHSGNILVKIAQALHLPGFTHDHSHADLVGRVGAVSVETVAIVDGLAGLPLAKE